MKDILGIKLLAILIIGVLGAFLMSCSESTQPKKATVVGSVLIEGLNNSEGVKVLLYQAGVVETELASIHADHPTLGFDLEDKHIFDHRDYVPLYSSITDLEGRFELKSVEYNNYIAVFLKEGYGPHYVFDVLINGEHMDVTSDESITLYEMVSIPQFVTGEMVLESGRTYTVENDAVFLPGSNVMFQGGTSLLVSPGKGISCNGVISMAGSVDDPIKITSGDKIHDFGNAPSQFAKFEVTELASVTDISGLVFTHSTDGMVIKPSNLELTQSLFARNNIGCMFTSGQSVAIEKSYFVNSEGIIGKGLVLQDVADVSLGYSVFYNIEKVSLNIVVGQGVAITNCLFTGGQSQIVNSFSSQTTVTNSTFSNASYNLTNTARSTLDIQYCDLSGGVCIYSYHTANQGNYPLDGWMRMNFSNIFGSNHNVEATGVFYTYQDEYIQLDFSNNHWGSSSSSFIEDSIVDYYDLEPSEYPGHAWPLIEYIPFRSSKVVNAGVQ